MSEKSNYALPQLHGVLVLNKPVGPSSARCLNVLKRLGQRKIGHAGTLDPAASGVLLALLGHATKLSPFLMAGGEKVYSGALRLGLSTDTWDAQGRVLAEADYSGIDPKLIHAEIASWVELKEQPVPPYSAAKHEGQPMYKLARKGCATPQKVKAIRISEAELLDLELPFVRFRVRCATGTYVRSLAHSLGMRLGCGAVLHDLCRDYSHPFGLAESCSPEEVADDPGLLLRKLKSMAEALPGWQRIQLTPAQARRVRHGEALPCASVQALVPAEAPPDLALLCAGADLLALAEKRPTRLGPAWTVMRGLWD